MIRWPGQLAAGWNRFWFGSRSDRHLASLALFRICASFILFFAYVSRMPDLEFFYSEQGILPSAYRVTHELFRFRPTPLDGVASLGLLQGLHLLLLACLLLLMAGLFTRFAAVGAYVLHMCFLNRNMAVQFGLDTIGTFFLLYLCFTRCNARYSLDAKLFPKTRGQTATSHIFYRLMQLQVCIIYGYAGLTKLQGVRWWDGSAFWDVLSAGGLQRWDMSFVSHAPIVIATLVYVVLLWEIYFPALIWVPRLRLPMLAFGVAMHIGIVVFMNLPSFGFLMISLYALFLEEDEIRAGLKALTCMLPEL